MNQENSCIDVIFYASREILMLTGKILRDGQNGNGLVSSSGERYEFTIEQHWRSDTPPKLGASVYIEVNPMGDLISLYAVDIPSEMGQKLKQLSDKVQADGLPAAKELTQQLSKNLLSTIGIPRLVIFVGLLLSWYALNTLVIQVSSSYSVNLNLFQVLGFASQGSLDSLGRRMPSSGFYGFLAWVSALMLFLPMVWKHRLAVWGAAAPLVFMVLSMISVWIKIRSGSSEARELANGLGNAFAAQMADQMMKAVMQAISLGLGFYAALAFAIAGAFIAFKKSR